MSGKVLFVNLTNFYITPYFSRYVDGFPIDFDVVYWDRAGLDEKIEGANNVRRFVAAGYKDSRGKIKKLIDYIQFLRFVKRSIKESGCEKIVFLQSTSAVLLSSFLVKRFKKKYIVDVRDYSFERFWFFRRMERKAIHNSYTSFISSDGYRSFLPDFDYILVHNYTFVSDELRQEFLNKVPDEKVRISFIGLIRFMEQNKRIINFFKNDCRFQLKFIGKNANDLSEYIEANGVDNVELHDYFDPSETIRYYRETDVIMNLYGANTPLLDYAVSNKLYFSANLYLPILVCDGTYMETITKEKGLGFSMSLKNRLELDRLYEYIFTLDRSRFAERCDSFISEVQRDMAAFNDKIRAFYEE